MATKTIVIFSTKGGVGKTLVAANLAVTLGLYLRRKTALIDLDLHAAGDMPRWLDITADKSILDLAGDKKNKLTRVDKYDIDFLPGILRPNQAPHLDNQKIKAVLESLEGQYDFVIIDAGRAFSESMFSVFNHANLILLVVTPDVLSVYQTKWSLDVLQSVHIPLSMIKIVLNRAESLGSVSWQEIRAAVPCEIISRIPSDGKA
ncbi:MAG: AAA family ATPase, partial [Candidatus Omnitrophota bacterium]|nr:AAA family ATPase [Candidatus Omnitrophota bacterium]